MKKNIILRLSMLVLITGFIAGVHAQESEYQVTVTNLTRQQPLSPVFAVTHSPSVKVFELGAPAISALAALAQDGDASMLKVLAQSAPQLVASMTQATAPTPPGASTMLMLSANEQNNSLTLLSMLVNTNDAFIALNGIKLPDDANPVSYLVPAYDAGAEDNDENCMYIPGPACNNPNKASAVAGEGFVYVSPGIHGIADLAAATYDWRNPAAKITIVKMK